MAEEKVTTAVEAAEKPAKKPTVKKKPAAKQAAGGVCIKLTRSLIGRKKGQVATALSLGLKRIGDTTVQPENAATAGKIKKISHMIEVSKA